VRIAGIELTDRAVLALAAQLRQHGYECTAISIERAFDAVAHDYALSIEQREQVLRSLDNRPDRQLGSSVSASSESTSTRLAVNWSSAP